MLPDPLVSAAPLFYRYQGPAHLDRLEAMVRTSAVYVPTAHQLNDPLDGRPRIAPMTADQLVAALQQGERALYPDLGAIEIDRRMVMIDINVRKHGAADILRRFSDGFHRTVAQTRRRADANPEHVAAMEQLRDVGQLRSQSRRILLGACE